MLFMLLCSWTQSTGTATHTVVFLGYSENNGATQDFDLTRRNRTLFMKVGYAWRP